MFAAASLMIHPWIVPVVWLAAIMAWEFVVRPRLDRVVLQLPPARAITAYAGVNFVGAWLYVAMALGGLADGSPVGIAIAAPWLVGESEPHEETPPDELYEKLKPFKERVAEDIRDS